MINLNLYEKTAHELYNLLTNKTISTVELTEEIFKHIDETEKSINACITLTKDEALKTAKSVDEKIAKSENIKVLEGIPCAIKDNICTKGIKTTCASKILENFVPPYNLTVMTKLNAINPVVLGKANMDEFAMGGSTENSGFHVTHNPHDLERVKWRQCSGSSKQ